MPNSSESKAVRLTVKVVALAALSLALLLAPLSSATFVLGVGLVFADDDDDDGGGGGGSGRGAGSDRSYQGSGSRAFRRFFAPRRATTRQGPRRAVRAPRRAPPQVHAPSQIVAVGLGADQIASLTAGGFSVVERTPMGLASGELVTLEVPRGRSLESARDEIRALGPTISADFNHFYRPQSAGPCGGNACVAPTLVGWPSALGAGRSCDLSRVKVGLIDTAINPDHPTFAESRLEVIRLGDQAGVESGRQHGTAVASLLVGTGSTGTPGLIPDVELIAVDAFRRASRQDDRANVHDVSHAIDLLVGRSVGVANLSFSGPENTVLAKMIELASTREVILVAAAGNAGPKAKPVFPAAYEEVLAVTAVDRGKTVYRRANRGAYVDLAAPGVGVWTAASIEGARQKTGTSFAAPFVTAAAVLARASGAKTNREVQQILSDRAEDLGEPGRDSTYGWGLLNVRGLCE
jgi:subtilisin family serine protease